MTRPCDPTTLAEPCVDCGRRMHRAEPARMCADGHPAHHGHGRCGGCTATRWYAEHRAPLRRNQRRDDLLAEWAHLRSTCTFRGFPGRVGVTYAAWERAFYRARAAGDPRAVRGLS